LIHTLRARPGLAAGRAGSVRAGGIGVVEDLLAAGLDRPGGAVVNRCRGVQPDPGMAVVVVVPGFRSKWGHLVGE
jgi:hypothetical protein